MPNAILRLTAVKELTSLSRSTIYNKIDPRSRYFDPDFPRPISLGARAVGWDQQSIEGWINRQIERSRNDDEWVA